MRFDDERIARLQREQLMLEAIERLLSAEIGRLYRERDRCEAQEWDSGDAVTEIADEIAQVKVFRERLAAAREQVHRELREAEVYAMVELGMD